MLYKQSLEIYNCKHTIYDLNHWFKNLFWEFWYKTVGDQRSSEKADVIVFLSANLINSCKQNYWTSRFFSFIYLLNIPNLM